MRSFVAVVLLVAATPAAAQGPEAIAGYVIDLRGATSDLPKDTAFFPGIPVETIVPARGFGFDIGGHVYLFRLGASRVGAGVNYLGTRGTAPGVVANVRVLAPQLSFNFGSRDGWSYLSAGFGSAWVETTADSMVLGEESRASTADSGPLNAINYGGGARWFLRERLGVGFDVRFHRVSGPPQINLFSASVGFSVR